MAPPAPFPSSPSYDYALLRPFTDSRPTEVILGPHNTADLPAPEDFPFSSENLPITAQQIDLSSWISSSSAPGRSLRTWPTVSKAYISWLDRVQATYADQWKEIGIFEAIQLFRSPPIADHLLLASALCFWSTTYNTFFFRPGPFTPTLLDVTAIIGLRPHGTVLSMAFTASGMEDFEAQLDKADAAYTKFILRFAGSTDASVDRTEHTAFLLYWLCHNLFCTRSQKINRDFVPIAVALADGEKLALGPYFLSFVYRELFESIRHTNDGVVIGSGCGVLWFIQMCL